MNLLQLPTETRLRIFEELLAYPSAIVVSVPHTLPTQNSRFKIRTVRPLSPQLLRVCRQTLLEGRRVLYGSHRFNCAFSVLGIGKLRAQIGPLNFGHVKHLIIGWSDLRRLSHSFRNNKTSKLYQSLETLAIQGQFLVDLERPGNLFYSDLYGLYNHCQSAREILRQHPRLNVLAQMPITDHSPLEQSFTEFRIKWRLLRSTSAMLPNVSCLEKPSLRRYSSWSGYS